MFSKFPGDFIVPTILKGEDLRGELDDVDAPESGGYVFSRFIKSSDGTKALVGFMGRATSALVIAVVPGVISENLLYVHTKYGFGYTWERDWKSLK